MLLYPRVRCDQAGQRSVQYDDEYLVSAALSMSRAIHITGLTGFHPETGQPFAIVICGKLLTLGFLHRDLQAAVNIAPCISTESASNRAGRQAAAEVQDKRSGTTVTRL